MAIHFNEQMGVEGADAMADVKASEFPWGELYARLDGDDGEIDTELDIDIDSVRKALRAIHGWTLEPFKSSRLKPEVKERMVGRRLLAVLWVICPDVLGDDLSAAEVGRRVGVCRGAISEATTEVTQRFGVRNAFQCHGRSGLHAAKLMSGDTVPTGAMRRELDAV